MPLDESLRSAVLAQAQGTAALNVAFVGIANGLFDALDVPEGLRADDLAARAGIDAGYARRWCDAAFAFGYVDARGDVFDLTPLGRAFRPSVAGTLMPFAVQSVLGAHMAERAAALAPSGERPGESVLAERPTILPWFGPMLESSFAPLFKREILPAVLELAALDRVSGTVIDLGCGNGWYLRALAERYPRLRGIGVDGFEENVLQATKLAQSSNLADRLAFRTGDLHNFRADAPVDLIAMNRALHHVWEERREDVFRFFRDALKPGGSAVIWEPAWPDDRAALREPRRRAMAVQNLNEHLQGNHFLRPSEIEAAFREVGMAARTLLFADGTEAVVIGVRS